jgi:hypothetical protein
MCIYFGIRGSLGTRSIQNAPCLTPRAANLAVPHLKATSSTIKIENTLSRANASGYGCDYDIYVSDDTIPRST